MKIQVWNNKEEKESQPEIMVDNEDLLGKYTWDVAIKQIELLNSLNYKGFNDWRLPTKEELNEMYLERETVGGFAGDDYWSSTESNANYAWIQYFDFGSQGYDDKVNDGYVRCVRSI